MMYIAFIHTELAMHLVKRAIFKYVCFARFESGQRLCCHVLAHVFVIKAKEDQIRVAVGFGLIYCVCISMIFRLIS